MRKAVHGAGLLCVAVAVAGCAFTTGSQLPAIVDGARPSAVSAPSTGPFGILAIPAGATPWTSNTDAPMSLEPYIDEFWVSSARAGRNRSTPSGDSCPGESTGGLTWTAPSRASPSPASPP